MIEGLLFLEDGTVYKGKGFGAEATRVGELVFNTAMVGYQEILTDPSYTGQIINMTYPLIGNYGISGDVNESEKIHAFGVVARSISKTPSHYASVDCIDNWLSEMGVPGVSGVDTRSITRKIRGQGTLKCVISTQGISRDEARSLCRQTELKDDYMKTSGVKDAIHIPGQGPRIAVYDFGIRKSVLSCLIMRSCDIYQFPYDAAAEEMLEVKPQGILLSDGPGNPESAAYAVSQISKLMQLPIPVFGIGMGHLLMALAAGGEIFKLKFGHRGGNHGVYDKELNRSYIIEQNHSYAVKAESIILKNMEISHINLNDETVEGMKHNELPHFSLQFFPGSSQDLHDSAYIFDRFIDLAKGGAK